MRPMPDTRLGWDICWKNEWQEQKEFEAFAAMEQMRLSFLLWLHNILIFNRYRAGTTRGADEGGGKEDKTRCDPQNSSLSRRHRAELWEKTASKVHLPMAVPLSVLRTLTLTHPLMFLPLLYSFHHNKNINSCFIFNQNVS